MNDATRSWHRPIASHLNQDLEQHTLYKAYHLDLSFQDLDSTLTLKEAYVPNRYTTNQIEECTEWFGEDRPFADKRFLPSITDVTKHDQFVEGLETHAASAYKPIVPDRSERNIVELIEKVITKKTQPRTVFLTGKIGVGKSTLLDHLIDESYPRLKDINPIFRQVEFVKITLRAHHKNLSKERLTDYTRDALLDQTKNYHFPAILEANIATRDRDLAEHYKNPEFLHQKLLTLQQQFDTDPLEAIKIFAKFFNKEGIYPVFVFDDIDVLAFRAQNTIISWSQQVNKIFSNSCCIVAIREYTLLDNPRFRQIRHLSTEPLLPPKFSPLLRKRFEQSIGYFSTHPEKVVPTIAFAENANYADQQYQENLGKLADAFDSSEIGLLLFYLSNSNARKALKIVKSVLSCPSYSTSKVLHNLIGDESEMKQSSKQNGKLLVEDDILTAIMLDGFQFYSSEENPRIVNLFRAQHSPDSMRGKQRSDTLFRYRLLDNIVREGNGGISTEQLKHNFCAVGFGKMEITATLQSFIDNDLIESRESSKVSETSRLQATAKGYFYIFRLSKTLVYIEHVIGDCWLDYQEDAYKIGSTLSDQLSRVLGFVDFLRREECRELQLIQDKSGHSPFETYKHVVNKCPVSWRILKSVAHRVYSLRHLFEDQKASNLYREYKKVARGIRDKISEDIADKKIISRLSKLEQNKEIPSDLYFS